MRPFLRRGRFIFPVRKCPAKHPSVSSSGDINSATTRNDPQARSLISSSTYFAEM